METAGRVGENGRDLIGAVRLNRRRLMLWGAGIASTGLLAACGGGSESTPTSQSAATTAATTPTAAPQAQIAPTAVVAASPTAATPVASGDTPRKGGTLTVALSSEPQSMDNYIASAPSSGVVYDNIFDEMVILEKDGSIVPGLAASWQVTEPQRWRFPLQPNAKWHTGEPLTADDVKFHFDRVFNKEKPGRPVGLTPGLDHAEVADPKTIDIVTKTPYPMMANDLAPRWNVISSNPAAVKQYGDQYGEHPVGTGPFKFVEWKKGDHITLKANDDYWGGRPYLDQVVFRFIPEDAARLLALEGGEVDYVYGFPYHEVKRLEADKKYKVLKTVTFVTQYFEFNASHKFFQDARVRNAIAYAIDKKEITEVAFEGQAQVAEQLISPGIAGYDSSLQTAWPYDLVKAKSLLAEAGWKDTNGDGILDKDGAPFAVEYAYSTGTRYPEEVSSLLQSQLKKVGIDLQIRKWEDAALLTEYPKGNLPCYAYAQGLGSGHFGQLAYVHFHSKGGRNYNFLYKVDPTTTAKLDQVLDASASEFDAKKRQDLWRQVMETNREQALMIPLYHPFDLAVTSAKVIDAYVHPGEYVRLKKVWIKG